MDVQPVAPGSRIAIKFVSNKRINDQSFPTMFKTTLVFKEQEPLSMAEVRVNEGKHVAWLFGQGKLEQGAQARLRQIHIKVTMRQDYTVSVPAKYAHARYFVLRYHPGQRVFGFSEMLFKIRDNGDLLRAGSSTPLKKQPASAQSGS